MHRKSCAMKRLYMVVINRGREIVEKRLERDQTESIRFGENAFLAMSDLSSDILAYTLFSNEDGLHSEAIHGMVCSAADVFGLLPDSVHHWFATLAESENSGIAQLNDYGPTWAPPEHVRAAVEP